MRWCDGAEKEPRYLLYLPIARSVPCHTRFLGFFPASSPPGHGLSSPCRASPCLGKSGRALLGTLRPSASRDICWASDSVDSEFTDSTFEWVLGCSWCATQRGKEHTITSIKLLINPIIPLIELPGMGPKNDPLKYKAVHLGVPNGRPCTIPEASSHHPMFVATYQHHRWHIPHNKACWIART